MTGVEFGQDEADAALLEPLLSPGMTAIIIAEKTDGLARLMAELVGPSGHVLEVDPNEATRFADVMPAEVDLMLFRTGASEHLVLREVRGMIERARPLLFVEFWPQGLVEAKTDSVSVLDDYRAMGLRATGADRVLPTDPGELALALDAAGESSTTLRLELVDPPPPVSERLLPASRRLGRKWARRFPPVEPNTLAYDAIRRALESSLLESEEWFGRFASGAQLPHGLGVGFDERVVEYPWLLSRGLSGHVLDAGSVLNYRHLLNSLLPTIEDLTILTLAPEPRAFTEFGVSYLYGDMRTLPLRDDWFDEVVCLSTLEHVGMDNSVYGAAEPRAENPSGEAARALRELLRVVRPGGRIHLSVPFGRREEHGWFRQLDREDVDDVLASAGVGAHEETVFVYTARGWRRSRSPQAAELSYETAPNQAADGAVAARAVLCATLFA